MGFHDLPGELRRRIRRWALVVLALVAIAVVGAWFLQTTIPRHIVLASGLKNGGVYHEIAQRYKEILAREGVTVEERFTDGALDNAHLLLDPKSGVDVAFIPGGVVPPTERGNLVMLAALHYEPLWLFYRGPEKLTQLDELRYKRIAIGPPGTSVRAFAEPLLAANNVTGFNTQFVPLVNRDALRALQTGEVDAALLLAPVTFPAVWEALHDSDLKLMSVARADAYPRKFPYITKLILPAGTIDLALRIPPQDVTLIGTRAMLVARDGLPPAIVNLLLEAGRGLHGSQGYFEADDEFPNTATVDLPVSADAVRHLRFGESILHRHLPFFVATYVERLIILLVPLLVLLVPLINIVPQALRWQKRSKIYRWYGELALLERDVDNRTGSLPIDQWLADLDRIERAAEHIRIPASFASEAYTLREHISLVRRAVMAKAPNAGAGPIEKPPPNSAPA